MWRRVVRCGYCTTSIIGISLSTSSKFFSSALVAKATTSFALETRSFCSVKSNSDSATSSDLSSNNIINSETSADPLLENSSGMWQHPQHHRAKVHHEQPGEIPPPPEVISPDQTFYFIRHGITEMNEVLMQMEWGSPGFHDMGLWDTQLSINGAQQAQALHHQWRTQYDAEPSPTSHVIPWEDVELVISSPLLRTLQTYNYLMEYESPPLIKSHVPKIAHPLLRERLYLSSDEGSPRSKLESSFSSFDFSALPADDSIWWYTPETHQAVYGPYVEWRPPTGEYKCPGEPATVFADRLNALRKYLLSRSERRIVVVAHWGVIRGLTGGDFRNLEVRAVRAIDLLQEPFIDP